MRVLVSPDKFKGTLSAAEAATTIARAVSLALPMAQVTSLPVADGGEGTVETLASAGWTRHVSRVAGPSGTPVEAVWASRDTTAVIEIAGASGLSFVEPNDESAANSDTFGTGQLILEALDWGASRVVLGLGGSATTDGGTGILRALGARFVDASDRPVPPGGAGLDQVARADLSGLDRRLLGLSIDLCCDVAVPMVGKRGAAWVFAPQKGAKDDTVHHLDLGLMRLASSLQAATGRDPAQIPWGGAAGGTAGGLFAALHATYSNGLDTVAELIALDEKIANAHLVIVGEGSLDAQSLAGKAPVGVARRARRLGVVTMAVAGQVSVPPAELHKVGIAAAFAAAEVAGSVTRALANPTVWIAAATIAGIRETLASPAAWRLALLADAELAEPC